MKDKNSKNKILGSIL